MKSKIMIVANWKMNPETEKTAEEIFKKIKRAIKGIANVKLIVCPPFVYLSRLEKVNSSQTKGDTKKIILGAQDVFWEKSGSYTGEISPEMIKNESYVIVGHSERRELGETDEMVAKKTLSAIKSGLFPIVCIGEKTRDQHGEYLHFLRKQLSASFGKLPKRFLQKVIIAYEPVWAIGKNEDEAMKPSDIHEATLFIRKIIAEIYDSETALNIPILYGGSVSRHNAGEIISAGEVQGLLVGRESLNPERFAELLAVVSSGAKVRKN